MLVRGGVWWGALGRPHLQAARSLVLHQLAPGRSQIAVSAVQSKDQPVAAEGSGVVHTPAASPVPKDGLRLVYEPASRRLSFRPWTQKRNLARMKTVQPKIDIMLEGKPFSNMSKKQQDEYVQQLGLDAGEVVRKALKLKAQKNPKYILPRVASLSLVLCDDAFIARLNSQHRGKTGPTDVLSFEMDDELDYKVQLPVKLLGDMVISVDTARRQARERGYSLLDESRVLLVHGMLHLCGYDHEQNDQDLLEMAAAEKSIMDEMGWTGQGLIAAVGAEEAAVPLHDKKAGAKGGGSLGGFGNKSAVDKAAVEYSKKLAAVRGGLGGAGGGTGTTAAGAGIAAGFRKRPDQRPSKGSGTLGVLGAVFGSELEVGEQEQQQGAGVSEPAAAVAGKASSTSSRSVASKVKLVALDMDGTLLDSTSKIRPSSVDAIKAACDQGVTVILATGKARPAAIRACEAVGLAGPNLLVHATTPGIFLQGLAVHGKRGAQLADAQLPAHVVEKAFRYLETHHPGGDVSLVAFTGDECVTLRMTDDLQSLHHVYYEPLASVAPTLDALLRGAPVRKLLFMTTPKVVDGALKPHWGTALSGSGASILQAVPNMLEIVPEGVDKWVGAQLLLSHLGFSREQLMAVGDGSNDLQLVANAGVGVAMGNAVPAVKQAAKAVVAHHDKDGIAEAFERFVL